MATAASPAQVARTLRRAREQRGASLSEATEATKIDARYLEALENDAPIDRFPAPAYARFFLREYAQYLDLDCDELLRSFEAQHPLTEDQLPDLGARLTPIDRRPGRFTMPIVTSLSVLAVVAIAVVSVISAADRGIRELPGAPSPPAVAPAPAPTVGSAGGTTGEPAARPTEIRAVLAFTDRTWLRATVDGAPRPGVFRDAEQRMRLRADRRIDLRLGNAGNVRLTVNGGRVRTGAPGEVVELTLRLRDGELVIRRT